MILLTGSLAFGNVAVGQRFSKNLTVTNTGKTNPLIISNATPSDSPGICRNRRRDMRCDPRDRRAQNIVRAWGCIHAQRGGGGWRNAGPYRLHETES